MVKTFIKYKVVNGTSYHEETSDTIVSILENARISQTRLRFYFGDVKTGRDYENTFDVFGYVGRSTGPVKIPILLHNSKSIGGSSILDYCIIRIEESKGKKVLYSHPNYHKGTKNGVNPKLEDIVVAFNEVLCRVVKHYNNGKFDVIVLEDTQIGHGIKLRKGQTITLFREEFATLSEASPIPIPITLELGEEQIRISTESGLEIVMWECSEWESEPSIIPAIANAIRMVYEEPNELIALNSKHIISQG